MKEVTEPKDVDVLLGRGPSIANSPGNLYFRNLVNKYGKQYKSCNDTKLKIKLAHKMVKHVKDRGGRFLYFNEKKRTWIQVKDERAQEKAKQILRDHGAKVAGGKVVAPITKAATKGKTAAVEATKPPTTTLLLTPNTTNTKDDVEMVIKTRPSFSSSSSPSEKKKKKAKTIQSKHHKRSTSSISTSSHKENVVKVTTTIPKHRLMVESIYDIDMVKMTKAMKKKKRHQRRHERSRGVTPSPPSRHSGNNLLSAFTQYQQYQQLPSQLLRQQTQTVVKVKPTKDDIASHDLDEIRQMLAYYSSTSSVDNYHHTNTNYAAGTTSYSYQYNTHNNENVDENTMHTLMEQHFTSKQHHQSYCKPTSWSSSSADQHTTLPPPSGGTNNQNIVTMAGSDNVVNIGHSPPPPTPTTKTWKRYTAPSWSQTTESSESSSLTLSDKSTWWKKYQALKKFHNTHGHYVVPPDYDDGTSVSDSDNEDTLVEWTARQRQINREITHGYRHPTIQETEQMKLLKTINFPMDLDSILPRRRPNNNKSTSTIGQQGNKRKFQELEEGTPNIDVLFGDEPTWGNGNEDAILLV